MVARPAGKQDLYDELKPLLDRPKMAADGRIWSFCPVHPDGQKHGRRSLSLHPVYGLDCFAGCRFEDVVEALRARGPIRSLPAHRQAKPKKAPRPDPEAQGASLARLYQYKDADGRVVAEKGRFEWPDGRKTFRLRLPGGTWEEGLRGLPLSSVPLYGAELLRDAPPDQTVYVVEGEKAAEACRARGLLAVTHVGGAGVKDFGDSLEVLRDRDVALWPDNDPPGRQHMATIEARLRGIARSIRVIDVPVPEKGDAFDYFAAGGTVEGLAGQQVREPAVDYLGEESLRIRVPTPMGTVAFRFDAMEKTGRELAAELTVSLLGPGTDAEPYVQRINLLSSSQRTELRRDLDAMYGKEFEWTRVVNRVVALARETFQGQDRSRDIWDVPEAGDEFFLMEPLLPLGAPTVFFGDGGSGKSYLAFAIAICVALGLPFCGMQAPEMPVLIVDYEDHERNVKRRLNRLVRGMGLPEVPPGAVYYWPARGVPLPDQADAVRRKVEKDGIGLVIIDSVAPACGGDPNDSQVTLAYFRALAKIGVTSLSIAHVNKGGDTMKPFGSNYWHQESRRTWYVARVQEEEADEIDVGLYCRKVNDGKHPAPLGFHLTFDGLHGPVSIAKADLREVPQLAKGLPLWRLAADVIQANHGAPMTAEDIAQALEAEGIDVDRGGLSAVLRRMKAVFVQVGGGPEVTFGLASTQIGGQV